MAKSKKSKKEMSAREKYNAVSDTVTGANFRLRDNLFQGLGILFFVIISALIGFVLAQGWIGALLGAFLGLVAGFFITGLILMIYRAVQHARGKHD